ncbi:bifunctional hydroxymethylpyrimidine kinase/phosphomethylpyrimidine kinase [Paenarthrobacter sp. Z7-10]|uniref:bifunctional hydroxymethylpyrimidine kinase/phosphomethylpyrimidine kinase n=1 Tax=Paenarthrobacter sp. Z7-10 TaxID=2787635 RepID=UPI0022A8F828|nr:bifunctional hydroxymethylpyrimidine kinase/phosphomethylpyrimidine kinase [Paenarthrobacter sp. Z7-10]MCZ2403941.1 bifunctional hydroxymethylpyrimidine kinase/phosphomethylpyrimidine kinase [Paenarthrobacter sp. Z7-10]
MSSLSAFDPAETWKPAAARFVPRPVPRVLSIAGSDPSGGAGIQADLKSIAANGGYGMAVVAALTAQNTRGVVSVHVPPAAFLKEQLDAVSDDVIIDAVKIGMLGTAEVIRAVAAWLHKSRPAVVVLDPVMVASTGDRLLDADAEEALRNLLQYADVVTPNLAELGVLLGEPAAQDWNGALRQGKRLAAGASVTVLVKGGHLAGSDCPDALVSSGGTVVQVDSARVDTAHTHGTGCSLSAGLATVQAQLGDWPEALRRVKSWLHGALLTADQLEVGSGHGPVNHFHQLWSHRPPAGDAFSAELWQDIAGIRAAIAELPFLRQLGDGSLSIDHFRYYLGQDALYLNGYSRVLARASALAPSEAEQLFWAGSAQNCLVVEAELHRSWLGPDASRTEPDRVTKSYLDHLLATAARGGYAETIAALLPCYWIYADVGAALHAAFTSSHDDGRHPYADWLGTYADPAFAAATRQAIVFTDAAARAASAREREGMRRAFRESAGFELDFFAAPGAPQAGCGGSRPLEAKLEMHVAVETDGAAQWR